MSDFDDTERFLKEMMNPTSSTTKGKAQKSTDDMDNILADLNSSVGNKKKTTNMEDDLTALENDIASQYEIEYEKLDDPSLEEGTGKKNYSELEVQQLNTFISKLSTGGLEELGNAITPFSQQQPETKKPEKNTNKWTEIEERIKLLQNEIANLPPTSGNNSLSFSLKEEGEKILNSVKTLQDLPDAVITKPTEFPVFPTMALKKVLALYEVEIEEVDGKSISFIISSEVVPAIRKNLKFFPEDKRLVVLNAVQIFASAVFQYLKVAKTNEQAKWQQTQKAFGDAANKLTVALREITK